MNESDISYLAGLFDGEGSVYVKHTKQKRNTRPGKPIHNVWVIRMEIAMTDKDTLKWCYETFKCGSFGEISILSFNGNKIITTSGGGMLLSNNKIYTDKAKKLASQSRENFIHYEHIELGYNYRMSNILAAIGRAQLKVLDQYVQKRRDIYQVYNKRLKKHPDIYFMPEIINGHSTRWLSVIAFNKAIKEKRKSVIEHLSKLNIETRPIWKPMHIQPLYSNCNLIKIEKSFSVSEKLFSQGLCLPSGSNLNKEDQDRVIKELMSVL